MSVPYSQVKLDANTLFQDLESATPLMKASLNQLEKKVSGFAYGAYSASNLFDLLTMLRGKISEKRKQRVRRTETIYWEVLEDTIYLLLRSQSWWSHASRY